MILIEGRLVRGLACALIIASSTPALANTFSASSFASDHSKERANWKVRTAWIKELRGEEQTVVLLLVRGALNQKLAELIEHNAGDDEGMRWTIGTQAWGNFMLVQLATDDHELREVFDQVSKRLLPIYRGTEELRSYSEFSDYATQELARRFSQLDLKRAKRTEANYRDSIKESGDALIVAAMIASSEALYGDVK
jgi:hypothetical protein